MNVATSPGRMKLVSAGVVAFVFGSMAVATTARAVPAYPPCPPSLGGYTATVQGNDVVVCATAIIPGFVSPLVSQPVTCPSTPGMVRVDLATGSTSTISGACVPDPRDGGAGAGTPCYLDSCVAPGMYEYGFATPTFSSCNGECSGPTTGEWAAVANVTETASGCTPSQSGTSPAVWADAGIEDAAVPWSATCQHAPYPYVDAGPYFLDAGTVASAADASPVTPDAGAAPSSPNADAGVDDDGDGGGCSTTGSSGPLPLAALAGIGLAFVIRAARRKR